MKNKREMARGGVPFSHRSFSSHTPERRAPKVAGVPMLLLRGGFRALLGDRFRSFLEAVLTIEALDPAGGIDQPLLAGIKRMAVRAHLDVKLAHRRASFECVSACARHYAAVVFGMDCSFHFTCPYFDRTQYHPKDKHTNRAVNGLVIVLLLMFGPSGAAMAASIDVHATSIPAGFAPPQGTKFAPILKLAAPGPQRAERAMAALDRQLVLQRLA